MKQRLSISAFVVCVAVLVVSCGGGGETPSSGTVTGGPRPVIVLAIDGLRADAFGSYGAVAATPAFDALAAESVRFEWAFAQGPHLQPSLASLFSGLYPTANGLRQPGEYLADEAQTLAEILGDAGYATAAFVEGSPTDSDRGLAQGFDSYQISGSPGDEAIAWMTTHAAENFLMVFGGWSKPALEKVNALLEGDGSPEGMRQRVQEVLASRATASPIEFTEEEMQWVSSWYAARVQVIDSSLDGFMKVFEDLGLDKRAALVVLGSNGFALQEHGGLFGETLHTPVTRVPVFVRLPDRGPQVISKVTEIVDLMPTILELVGQKAPGGTQGASLMPILSGAGQPPYIAFAESPQSGGQRFVALGGMGMTSGAGGENAAIFNLNADPLQLEDLSESEADKLAVMIRHLEAWEKMVAATSLDPELRSEEDLDEDTLKQLKSLGYIQ